MLAKLVDFYLTRFSEHYRQIKQPRKIDNFLYMHIKQTNHSISSISIQPVQKIHMIIIPLKDIEIFLGMTEFSETPNLDYFTPTF